VFEDGVELATYLAKDPSVISNVFFDCPSCAAGIFSTPGIFNMEIKEGVVMTSGFCFSCTRAKYRNRFRK
jgi:hypothetical protein